MVIRLLMLEGAAGADEFSWAKHAGSIGRIKDEILDKIPNLNEAWLAKRGSDLHRVAIAVGTRMLSKADAEDMVQAAIAGLSESGARRSSSDFYGLGAGVLKSGILSGKATPENAVGNVSGVIKARAIDILKKKKRRDRALGGIQVEDMRVHEENLRAVVPSYSQMTEGEQTDLIMQILQGRTRLSARMRQVLKGIWRREGTDLQTAIMMAFLDLVQSGVSPDNLNKNIAKAIETEGFVNPQTGKPYTQAHVSIERRKMEAVARKKLKGTNIMRDLDDAAYLQQLGYGTGYSFSVGTKKRVRKAMIQRVASMYLASRPGPQWNPWTRNETTARGLAQGLEDIAKLAAKYPNTTDWTPETVDLVANIAWAVKKGDRIRTGRLLQALRRTGQVAPGTLNEIQMFVDGQIQ